MAADKVEKAIAAAAAPPPAATLRVRLHTGREIGLMVPVDLTPIEVVDMVGYIARQLPAKLAEARGPASRLVVANGPIPKRPA